jgi:hypothetical protein
MEREGFIQYYQAIPNLCLFGRPLLCTYGFRAPTIVGKQVAIQILKDADGIVDIAEFIGEMCGPTVAASTEDEADKTIQRIGERAGFPGMRFIPPRSHPDC